VSDELGNESNDATKADTTASEACTRSGAFALALTVVLLVLVRSWANRPNETALAQYLAYRYDLALYVDRLDVNPVWKTYKDSNPLAEFTSLSRLPNRIPLVSSSAATPVETTQKHLATTKPIHTSDGRPLPPTGLTATVTSEVEMTEISGLVDVFKKLNDSKLLTDSRRYSNFFDISITRWAQRRGDLIYRNAIVSGCAKKEIEVPNKGKVSEGFVSAIEADVLLECLYLSDVRDLAQFEQPVMTNPDQIGGHTGRDIDIAPGALPRETYTASLVSESLLFFVLIYFGAFAKEATLSKSFPVQGTLFGAFSRSQWTLIAMFLALCTPFVASLAVAIESKRPLLWVGTVLLAIVVCSIVITLNRKSYWTRLKNSK
jgi:hypothetical protein